MMRGLLLALALCWLTPAVAAEELYPLTVGSWWQYKVAGENDTQTTSRITESKVIGSETWYRLVDHGATYWIRNGGEGQLEAIALFGTDGNAPAQDLAETLVFKYPVALGETYAMGEDQVRVDGERTITTAGGEFVCTMYIIELGGGDFASQCITPGVGPVEIEFFSDGHRSVSRLIDYHIER